MRVDNLSNLLMLCIRVMHAIFKKDESLLEDFLKQATLFVLIHCLGMQQQQDLAKRIVEMVRWNTVIRTFEPDFKMDKRPPLQHVVQRVLGLLEKDDVLSDKSRKRNKAKKAFRAHLIQHLRGEVRKTLDHWKIEPHEVAPEEQEKLVSLMVEQSSKKWKVIADIVIDPKSAPEVFVTVLGSVCTSETRELLQKMVGIILMMRGCCMAGKNPDHLIKTSKCFWSGAQKITTDS